MLLSIYNISFSETIKYYIPCVHKRISYFDTCRPYLFIEAHRSLKSYMKKYVYIHISYMYFFYIIFLCISNLRRH